MIQYDPHSWRELFDLRGTMLAAISRRGGTVLLWSALVTILHFKWRHLAVPETAHSLLGPALSLLLVFRTNASYDRFWEGRKLWGSIVNISRNITRLARVYLAKEPHLVQRILRLVMAFPYAAMGELRGQRSLGPVAQDLGPESAQALLKAQHTPAAVAREITLALDEARHAGLISDIIMTSIDQNAQALVDCIGACERIHKTPLPFAYVVHLRRALALYCFTLPFALLSRFGWETIAIASLISTVLLGIEEVGVEIEDPFGIDDNDLPLESICAGIEAHVRGNMPS